MNNQKIGIIVPFYQGDDFIMQCVSSLHNSSLPENYYLNIIIVDNDNYGSKFENDFTQHKNIIYLKTKPAIGYGRACNIGASKAIEIGCDYICLLNQDTIVDDQMLVNLIKILSPKPSLTVCSPMIFDYNFEYLMEMVIVSYVMKNRNYLQDTYLQEIKSYYQIPTIGAACTIMHRSVIEKIGLYDPILYLYGEDYDFFRRLSRVEGRLLLVTNAKLGHRASMNETDKQKKWLNKWQYEKAQLIKIIRYDQPKKFLKETLKIAWIFLRNGKFKLLGEYLYNALYIYSNQKKYLLPSDETIKKRMAEYQKKDVVS